MLIMNKLFLIICLCLPIMACTDNEQVCVFGEGDYLIFGTFYGECAGNCTVVYKIQNNFLFEDDQEIGIPEEIPFLPAPLSNTKYQIAEEMLSTFPSDLLNSDKDIYGCPDCADQGGVYLETGKGNETRKWRIDAADSEQSAQILAYKARLYAVMDSLR